MSAQGESEIISPSGGRIDPKIDNRLLVEALESHWSYVG